jgi:hypothetical protein
MVNARLTLRGLVLRIEGFQFLHAVLVDDGFGTL